MYWSQGDPLHADEEAFVCTLATIWKQETGSLLGIHLADAKTGFNLMSLEKSREAACPWLLLSKHDHHHPVTDDSFILFSSSTS